MGHRTLPSALLVSIKHLHGAPGGLLIRCASGNTPMRTQHFQDPQQVKWGTETNRMELNKESWSNLPHVPKLECTDCSPKLSFK